MGDSTPHPVFAIVQRNLIRYRDMQGITQADLIEACGEKSVKQIEAGNQGAHVGTLFNIARALGLTIADLFFDTEAPVNEELDIFFLSPVGKSATAEERGLLRGMSVPGRKPTAVCYQHELAKLRAMSQAWEKTEKIPPGKKKKRSDPAQASPVAHTPGRQRLGGGRNRET